MILYLIFSMVYLTCAKHAKTMSLFCRTCPGASSLFIMSTDSPKSFLFVEVFLCSGHVSRQNRLLGIINELYDRNFLLRPRIRLLILSDLIDGRLVFYMPQQSHIFYEYFDVSTQSVGTICWWASLRVGQSTGRTWPQLCGYVCLGVVFSKNIPCDILSSKLKNTTRPFFKEAHKM